MRGAGGGGFQAQSFPGGAGLDGPGVGGFGKIGGQPGELKGLLRQKYQQQGGDESTSLSDTTKALSKAALGGGQPQSPGGGPGFF